MAKDNIKELKFDEFISRNFHGLVVKGDEYVDRPRQILPTCLSLDIALTGGIPEGKIVLLTGHPKGGKSTLSLTIGRNAIRQDRKVFYVDVERRLDPSLLKTIGGLDIPKLNILPANGQTVTAENYFKIIERGIKDNPRSLWIIDSIAALSTLAEQSEATGEARDMAGVPKLMASFLRKIKDIININNCILVLISQLQTNRDPASKRKYDEKGGLGVQYGCSIWISLGWVQQWKKDESGEIHGQDMHLTIKASALGKPYRPCVVPLRFGQGIDEALDLMIHAENLGLIERSGAWYTIPLLTKEKYCGQDNLRTALLNKETNLYTELEKAVRTIILPEDPLNKKP